MKRLTKKFSEDCTGAVTVEWVVLSAVLVGLMYPAFSHIMGALPGYADTIVDYVYEATDESRSRVNN